MSVNSSINKVLQELANIKDIYGGCCNTAGVYGMGDGGRRRRRGTTLRLKKYRPKSRRGRGEGEEEGAGEGGAIGLYGMGDGEGRRRRRRPAARRVAKRRGRGVTFVGEGDGGAKVNQGRKLAEYNKLIREGYKKEEARREIFG